MSNLLKLALAALFVLAGCAPMEPMPSSDAMPVTSQFGTPVMSGFNVPETGRNWNCRTCYK